MENAQNVQGKSNNKIKQIECFDCEPGYYGDENLLNRM